MQIEQREKAMPVRSTSTDPSMFKVTLEATGNYQEIAFFKKKLKTFMDSLKGVRDD